MTSYKLTQAAQADIQNIWDYTIEKWSFGQAETYVFGLIDVQGQLDKDRLLIKDKDDVRVGYKRLTYRKHHIYFKIDDAGVHEQLTINNLQFTIYNCFLGLPRFILLLRSSNFMTISQRSS